MTTFENHVDSFIIRYYMAYYNKSKNEDIKRLLLIFYNYVFLF